MSRRFAEQVRADHRKLARHRPRARAHARGAKAHRSSSTTIATPSWPPRSCAKSKAWRARIRRAGEYGGACGDRRASSMRVEAQFGRLDYFVSNAAASSFKKIDDLKAHNLDRSYALNVRAFVLGAQRAVKLMTRRRTHRRTLELRQHSRLSRPTRTSARTKRPSKRGCATWRSSLRRAASTSTPSTAA